MKPNGSELKPFHPMSAIEAISYVLLVMPLIENLNEAQMSYSLCFKVDELEERVNNEGFFQLTL